MSYHGGKQHSTTWQLMINEDGTAWSAGDTGMAVDTAAAKFSNTNQMLNLPNGSTLWMGYDPVAKLVKYYAHVA